MCGAQLSTGFALGVCFLLCLPQAQAQSQRNNSNQRAVFGTQRGVFGASNTTGFGGQQGNMFGPGVAGSQRGGGLGIGRPGQMGDSQFGAGQQPGMQGQGSNAGQDGFVGGDAQDMRNAFENMRGRDRRRVMFDLMVENLNDMRDRRAERDARRRQPDLVRVQLRPPANLPPIDTQQVSVTLRSNLTRSLELQGLSAPQVELNGRTATVSGSVPSDHERAVIERMILLQPGVSQVESRLTVDPAAVSADAGSGTAPSEPSSAQ